MRLILVLELEGIPLKLISRIFVLFCDIRLLHLLVCWKQLLIINFFIRVGRLLVVVVLLLNFG